ncbi:uncharacterized protein LOC128858891 [Anastrepha ludens]|uniref:uncharacterized protein LOC128858891 n=1 Tax=Anastrepha ludens TaxID=28586 RepID=UPI0023AF728B|nr:uncharacterized protein LOC128858891 [Anastrepha ludens]XP_053951426.1 uncharacterized protein LOC128858891 [Anastrepha ludens]XP_053951427.1 uncharacterized protein LOC128858891 [Anastrepha ludens]XP_053951428.1 uncharacterized protein LOC128858891 [Anastrepha ludens]XP_053951429.1 uncharacterized protein LOC128858891 [Anastrepha ludens]
MNEKLSLPAATPIEQLQQQQQQQQTIACATIDRADYHYESTQLPLAITYTHESTNSNNDKASGIDVGCVVDGSNGGAAAATIGAGGGASSELYRYASVASLGGGSTMPGIDAFMAGTSPAPAGAPLAPPATILKISNNGGSGSGSKGSNLNSPHKQQLGAPQRDNFCGCFGNGSPNEGVGVGDKQQLPALTFWPALFANLGICTLLLGYLFIGSFLFLTIETSGDGGSAAGVVSDPNAWSYAHNAYISTQQEQKPHKHPAETSFGGAQSKLYKSSEPLLDVATAGGMRLQGTTAAAAADGEKPHESSISGNFHVNMPNTKRQVAVNSTQTVATVAVQFDVIAKPETETYIDNKHANKLGPTNSMTPQQSNDAPAGIATYEYSTLRQAYRVAANTMEAAIGNDINGHDVDVDAEVGAGMADGEGVGEVMAAADGAWVGENVALKRTVENIWDITVSLNILYKENWTKLAALEINKFQDQLVKRLVMDLTLSTATGVVGAGMPATTINDAYSRQQQQLYSQQDNIEQHQPSQPYDYHNMEPATNKHYGNDAAQQRQQQRQRERYWQLQAARQRQWQLQQQQQQFEWNFATSFLYSLTVVTTVGYGTITPRTTLGRMVTIAYATIGIPLTLVYLSSIGSILAKLASGFCERLLCCCFCRASPNKRHTICGFSRQQVSDKKCNLKLQQLQKHHHQQQQQQQHPSNSAQLAQQQQTTQSTQSAHLPYCYVRPPADDSLSYAEHSPLSAHSGTRNSSAHTLRWSLALPLGFCVLLLLSYVAFGSLVIALMEQWPFFDGIYFCFMSLTTIGFCDLLPGAHVRPATTASTLVVWFCAAYILSGLTLTSMCVNLLHDEFLQRMRVVVKFKKVATGKNTAKERNFFGAPP